MKPAWDALGEAYSGSSSVLVGDCDCTDAGKGACEKMGVKGYPTIKYYKDGDRDGADYSGGRDADSLAKFVKETLEVQCDVSQPEGCDEKEATYIASMTAKGAEAIVSQLARLEGMLSKPMKPELKGWVGKRISILKQLSPKAEL
jgi:protein disulfide-isomerase A6